MEYNEMAAKRRKKLKSYAFMRLLRLFAAILSPHSVASGAASSVCATLVGSTPNWRNPSIPSMPRPIFSIRPLARRNANITA